MAQLIDLGKIRFNWAGTYSGSTEYSYNDLVKYGPNLYAWINTVAGSGQTPASTSSYWTLVTEGVAYKGLYESGTLYYKNDIVIDGTNTYIVLVQHTATSTPALGNANLEIIALGQEGLPSQAGKENRVLTTDGTETQWSATTQLTKGYWGTNQGGSAFDFETASALTDTASIFAKSTSDFGQLVMVNPSNGSNASSDVIVYTADGNNDSGWIDMGITSNNFNAATYGITGPHDGYIFMSAPRTTEYDVVLKKIVGSTATVTLGATHSYNVGNTIRIEGVDATFDGLHVITAIGASTVSFATAASPLSEVAVSPFGTLYKPYGDGNLVLATDLTGLSNKIVFAAGGFSSGTSQMEITPNEVVDIIIDTESTSNTTGALKVAGGVGVVKNVHVGGDLQSDGVLYVGSEADEFTTTADLTDPIAVFAYTGGGVASYAQFAVHNSEPTSSTDIILYMDNGTDATGWMGMGITGSNFDDETYGITGPGDGYIFHDTKNSSYTGNLVLATGNSGSENKIIFAAGGYSTGNTQLVITPDVNIHLEIPTPSTSPTTGALTVVGGVGITGDVNIAGSITFGGEGTQLTSENLSVNSPLIFTGTGSTTSTNDLGLVTEGLYTVTNIPVATVIYKALDSNVATLTTRSVHNFATGDSVVVANVDATFNGTYTVTGTPTTTTFTYAKTAGNVASTSIGKVDYTVTNKALTSNVATLTTSATHAMIVGTIVDVTGVDSTFNGTYTITAVTTNTFSYAKTATNVSSTSSSGTASYFTSVSTATVGSATRTRYNAWSKDATDGVWKLVSNISTLPVTLIDYSQNTYGNGVDIVYEPIKVGAITSTSNLDITGNFAINTNKFTANATTGNVAFTGDLAVNTNKFTVASASGNTSVAGTLGVTGIVTLSDDLIGGSSTDIAINTNKFTVTASSGNTSIAGTLGVTGVATFSGGATITGTLEAQEIREVVTDITLASNVATLDWTAGNVYYISGAPSAAMTFNVTNVPTTSGYMYSINVAVVQGATGYYPSTFQIGGVGQTIKWAGGVAPTPTSSAGKIDFFNFTMQRTSGGAWIVYGSAALNF